MPTLQVPNAILNYELYPNSPAPHLPLLLLIHGGNGGLDYWRGLANVLQTSFRICIYDRRGFSRSHLTGPQDYSTGSARLATDTDDVRALIEHLNSDADKPDQGAVIVGNSSGGLVALETLARHSDVISLCIAHEPPALQVLPDAEDWLVKQQGLYEMYRQQGHVAAMSEFRKGVRADKDAGFGTGADPHENPYYIGNLLYWFEREVMAYTSHEFDVEVLRGLKGKLVLVNGRGTHVDAPQYLCNVALGKKLNLEVMMFEGGHIAFRVDPETFAEELLALSKARGVL